MAEEIKKVITIETGDGERSVKSLKKEISDLRDSLLNVEKGGEEWQSIVEKLVEAQNDLNDVTKITKQSTDAAADSIVGMEKQYKSLYDTYKLLTEEQRNSDFGKNMAQSLEQLSSKLNETKQGVGNFKDNIGHYTQSVMDAFSKMGVSVGALQGPMKLASGGVKALSTQLKGLIANPVGAVIMAIVVAFKAMKAIVDQVKNAINANEESQMALKEAMSAFQPIIDGVKNAFDSLGQMVVKVVGFIGEAVRKIREAAAAVTDFLGITDGAKERIEQQNESYRELAQAQNELIKNKREYQKLNAKDKAEVERLREEAEATTDKTEKLKLLNEAKNIQAQIDERNLALAEENLRILQLEAEKTANDAAANERLAQAEAAVEEARATLNKNARTYTRQINTVTKAVKSSSSASDEAAEKLKKLKEQVEGMDETMRKSKLTDIQKLEEEKQKWIEIYKAAGKATGAVEAYYDTQINGIITNNSNKEQNANNDLSALLAQSRGATTAGVELTEEWIQMIDKYVNGGNAEESMNKIGEIMKNKLMDSAFPRKPEIDEKLQEFIDYQLSTLGELATNADYEKVQGNFERAMEKVLGIYGDFSIMDPSHPLNLEIEKTTKELYALMETVAAKGKPILSEDFSDIQGLTNYLAYLKDVKEAYDLLNEALESTYEGYVKLTDAQSASNEWQKSSVHQFLTGEAQEWLNYGQAVSNVLGNVASSWNSYIKSQVDAGNMTEETAKKQFEVIKALQISQAIINALVSANEAYASLASIPYVGPALGAAAAAAALAAGMMNVAVIRNTKFGDDGSGVGSDANFTPPVINDTDPFSYTRNVTTAEEEDALNKPVRAYVVESDVTAKQELSDKRNTETSF